MSNSNPIWPLFGRFFSAPRFREDEEKNRLARYISVVLNVLLVVSLFSALLALRSPQDDWLIWLGGAAAVLVQRALLMRGRVEWVIWILLLMQFMVIMASALPTGGVSSAGFLTGGIFGVVVGTLMLGLRGGIVLIGLNLAAGAFMAWMELNGILPPLTARVTPFSVLYAVGAFYVFILGILALTSRDTRHALQRARAELQERQRVESALRESEERFAKAFYNSPVAIAITHPNDGHHVAVNDAYLTLLDMSRDEVMGHTTHELGHIPRFGNLVNPSLEQRKAWIEQVGRVYNVDAEFRRKSGETRAVLISIEAITLGGEQHALVTLQDVTERKQAEARMQQLNAELEQGVAQRTSQLEAANRELEAFAYSVSHDLRAPLRAIDGFSRTLAAGMLGRLSADERHYIERILQNVTRMGRLIDDLLRFSRVGRQALDMAEVDLNRLLASILNELKTDGQLGMAAFQIEPLPPCKGDAALLKQALTNLISNAIKYSASCPEPRVEVGAKTEQGQPVYFVRDNGVGFDMAYADKLFGVFQRLHSASEYEGTGIGLAIVRRVFERHGGRVWAESEPGKGATFYFTLPPRLLAANGVALGKSTTTRG